MFWLHAVLFVLLARWIHRLRRRACQADTMCKFWMEQALSREVENSCLRQTLQRAAHGHVVSEAEIDEMLAELRSAGVVR